MDMGKHRKALKDGGCSIELVPLEESRGEIHHHKCIITLPDGKVFEGEGMNRTFAEARAIKQADAYLVSVALANMTNT